MWYHYNEHAGLDVNSRYGTQGVQVFDVGDGGTRGVGVHAGRANKKGWLEATNGCIRTTEAAMSMINQTHKIDPLRYLDYVP